MHPRDMSGDLQTTYDLPVLSGSPGIETAFDRIARVGDDYTIHMHDLSPEGTCVWMDAFAWAEGAVRGSRPAVCMRVGRRC